MVKKKAAPPQTKTAAKKAKKAKAAQKEERRKAKESVKGKKDDLEDDQDLEGILENMRREWEAAHAVTEELVEGPPSRRANATLTACPNGNHLWCIGGEFFSDDGKAYFYNDVFRYSPEKEEWRKFVSHTCPGPRSAHAVVASPMGGGKLFLFGGEFSSLHQNSFHHYRDFWCFDIATHSWDRIETKVRPTARSGHRMAMWKHYIVLFGGFYDPGVTTRYLNDLWIFDTQEYKWQQIELKDAERKPSPRSGFSFLPTADGIVLHGGYCKEYVKGKRPVGVMLEDTWFLRMSIDTPEEAPSGKSKASNPKSPATPTAPSSKGKAKETKGTPLTLKWERRKRPSTAFAPSLRSGCTMTIWASKNTGVLFGGVTDEDTSEETMESVFWNDLYGYDLSKGRWLSLLLRKPKQKKGQAKKTKVPLQKQAKRQNINSDEEGFDDAEVYPFYQDDDAPTFIEVPSVSEVDPDDPSSTVPMPRYNTMLAVLRNTLFIYGGIFERGSREYTLDDFYSLALDKLDRYICLKPSEVVVPTEGNDESSEGEDGSEDDSGESGSDSSGGDDSMLVMSETADSSEVKKALDFTDVVEGEDEEDGKNALREQAQTFMGISKDTARSEEDVISTPLPGESLAVFYARSREHWAQKARERSDNRGKMLRKDGFGLAEERYGEYKPILEEVERILAEAGLDEDEIKRAGAGAGAQGQNRNRR
ncbi:hypothetical protein OF83DRAFT_1184638 [Amylostereum chailletii]|nr:hypothetical protein OF83DRAFT_1184638 [Amylostereum chailletii]